MRILTRVSSQNIELMVYQPWQVHQPWQQHQVELHCRKFCPKQTGDHQTDLSHFHPFYRLSSRKLQTCMLIGNENPLKYKWLRSEMAISYLELYEEGEHVSYSIVNIPFGVSLYAVVVCTATHNVHDHHIITSINLVV